MRALEHNFNPFDQVSARLAALSSVGHPTDKVELLILAALSRPIGETTSRIHPPVVSRP